MEENKAFSWCQNKSEDFIMKFNYLVSSAADNRKTDVLTLQITDAFLIEKHPLIIYPTQGAST